MKRLLLCVLTATLLLAQAPSVSPKADSLFVKKYYINDNNDTLRYRLLSPQNIKEGKDYPLVLFLHGSGERGNDNDRQLIWGAGMFITDKNLKKFPCYVIAPQCPEDKRWVEVHWALETHIMPQEASENMALVMELMDEFDDEYPVNKRKIYVSGLSMGGYGTWDIISRMPEYFAAAAPVCGGGDEHQASKLVSMPIWAFHGGVDPVVPTFRSRNMVKAIKDAGGKKIRYTEYSEVGHGAWKPAFADKKLIRWMFRQKK